MMSRENKVGLLICCCAVLLFPLCSLAGNIVIGNSRFSYTISEKGENLHFIDKATGQDYLFRDTITYCAQVQQDGITLSVSAVSYHKNMLKLSFANADITALIKISADADVFIWELVEISGAPQSLTFINIPLRLKGLPNEAFVACVLSLNRFTQVTQLPVLQTYLRANCYARFGIKGARVALLGVGQQQILPAIRELMSKHSDLPASKAGGAWARSSNDGNGSYIMNFGSLTEQNVDEWIAYCSAVGFTQIDHHGGAKDFFRFGDFELEPGKWPDGWQHFKRINARLKKAGIASIFHTYAFFLDKTSRYVTPVPSPQLAWFRAFTLTKPISATDTVIEVKEPLSDISLFTGFHVRNSVTLKLGNELIEFKGVTTTAPFRFTSCTRGANGTAISSHMVNDTAYHLKELFGKFVPDPESPLFEEVAHRTADIVNDFGFEGIYFDAIDGVDILDRDNQSWYYASKFLFAVASRLQRPTSMEMSIMFHHFWHYRSRWQAWDVSRRGHKRFVDIHAAEINKGLLLPLNLGWWLNFTWDPPQTEYTFPDDVEYLGCKLIGYDAGLSLLGGYEKKEVDENPSFTRLNAIIKQYEDLRHLNYFGPATKKALRQPGKEFKLIKENTGKWNFKPVTYHKHAVAGSDSTTYVWKDSNEFGSQPLKLRIQSLMGLAPFEDPAAKVLSEFSGAVDFSDPQAAAGVKGEIAGGIYDPEKNMITGSFKALNSGAVAQRGAWVRLEKKFTPWQNLSGNQGLGLWIKGDGNGQLLNLRLESPYHLSTGARGDHFVKIDFKGWKYFELAEIESARFSDYNWPEQEHYYKSHMFSLQFSSIDKLQIWYNNLPEGKPTSVLMSQIKALPLLSFRMENPAVMINGKKIVFPVAIQSGMYLEFNSMTDCKLYGSRGELISEVTPQGITPLLAAGTNTITFSHDRVSKLHPRVEVTVISHGNPLINK